MEYFQSSCSCRTSLPDRDPFRVKHPNIVLSVVQEVKFVIQGIIIFTVILVNSEQEENILHTE